MGTPSALEKTYRLRLSGRMKRRRRRATHSSKAGVPDFFLKEVEIRRAAKISEGVTYFRYGN
jgi:hypothetical protein